MLFSSWRNTETVAIEFGNLWIGLCKGKDGSEAFGVGDTESEAKSAAGLHFVRKDFTNLGIVFAF
jgi:hypothetical protein